MSENKKYGYTGKGLRVDLTTGKITVEPTFPRFDGYIGGTALLQGLLGRSSARNRLLRT